MCEHADAAAYRFPFQRYRQQDQGSAKTAVALFVLLPKEKADCQIESICPAFLEGSLRLPVDFDRSAGQLLRSKIDEHLLPFQGVSRIFVGNDFAGALPVDFLVLADA
jgi:hypothetical protein